MYRCILAVEIYSGQSFPTLSSALNHSSFHFPSSPFFLLQRSQRCIGSLLLAGPPCIVDDVCCVFFSMLLSSDAPRVPAACVFVLCVLSWMFVTAPGVLSLHCNYCHSLLCFSYKGLWSHVYVKQSSFSSNNCIIVPTIWFLFTLQR